MPPNEAGPGTDTSSVPSMLDLVRLSRKRLFPPGGVELYRQIALLTGMSPGMEVLDVASGKGVPLEYFVKEFGVIGSGVDLDPAMVEAAEEWTRELGAGHQLQFQSGRSDALPYRDAIFDVAIGEIGLANHCRPEDAVRELVRVTKPGGFIVLVQLVWKAPVDKERRMVLSEHLGARPLMVVEWKRLLRESKVEDIHVEDWSDEDTAFRPTVAKPFPDFAELFSLGERISILHRAWQRWGLKGVSAAVARENEVHKLLTGERILGLDLLRGRKAGGAEKADTSDAGGETEGAGGTGAGRGRAEGGPSGGQDVSRGRDASSASTATDGAPTTGTEGDGASPPSEVEAGTGDGGDGGTGAEPHSDTVGLPLFGAGAGVEAGDGARDEEERDEDRPGDGTSRRTPAPTPDTDDEEVDR